MNRIEKRLQERPKKWIVNLIFTIALFVAVGYSFRGAHINMTRFETIGITFRVFFRQLTDINFELFLGYGQFSFNQSIIYLAIETLAIGFLGTFIGAILAIPFGFLASKSIGGKTGSRIGQGLLIVIRVLPEIILAIILVRGFGLNALTGIITIGIHSIGMIGKMYSEAVDNMDRSFTEALDAVGANTLQKIRWGIIPQISADFMSISLYRLDINVRSATVLGVVGAGGLGTIMYTAGSYSDWRTLGACLFAIIIVVLIVDAISSKLRSKLI